MNSLELNKISINDICEKINNNQTFTFSKYSIELWMMVWKSFDGMKVDIETISEDVLTSDEFIDALSEQMKIVWNTKQNLGRPWKFYSDTVKRIMHKAASENPENFMLGISDLETMMNKKGIMFLKKFLPANTKIYDSTCWKAAAYNGQIDQFMNNLQDKNVILIGPSHLANLNKKVKLNNFNYIQIDDKEAALHTKQTAKEILHIHKTNRNKYTVYLIQGGAAAIDLTTMLHDEIKNCCIIDIGRAIDVYYYYDPIRNKFPKWYWGGWLDLRPPTWLLEKTKV